MAFNSVLLAFLIAHLAILGYTFYRPKPPKSALRGVWAFIGSTIVSLGVLLIPDEFQVGTFFTKQSGVALAGLLTISFYGWLIIHDTTVRKPIARLFSGWWGVALTSTVAFAVSLLWLSSPFLGWREWQNSTPPLATWVAFLGLISMGILLIGVCAYTFYRAPMPEVANRSAYWLLTASGLLTSVILMTSGATTLVFMGIIGQISVIIATLFALYRHRIVDIRITFINNLPTIAFTAFVATLLFGTFYIVNRNEVSRNEAGLFGLALLAGFLATFFVPIYALIRLILANFIKTSVPNVAEATAEYSRQVALAPSLSEVINATNTALCKVMHVKRSALILINTTWRKQDAVEFVVLESGSTLEKPSRSHYISKKSPVYHTLAVEKVPLGMFDIFYGYAYREVVAEELSFFMGLGMHAFVPIVADGRLIGVLACGRRVNDLPFTREDMELLSVIGQQVGNALRNARLIDDLQHLNNSMRELNKRLENAKLELEKMDSIKTDFVTIASHELRTPLAQIRGYTDILDSLNESSALSKTQATQLVSNLRKSTERMEELIGAMLDVSQLDVNSMDLRFMRTTPETVIRMAIEPLREAIEQRKQTLERIGLNGLPHIQADMQRLVQAFRNIVINAIKYTPDGGKLEISARLEPATNPEEKDKILFIFKDTGIGIQQKDIKLIFQKFYRGFDTQLHSTGLTKFLGAGPGLGLTIAKGIIEGHGGEIWAESPGQDMANYPGATFYVRLPILPAEGQRVALPFEGQLPDERRKTSSVTAVVIPQRSSKELEQDTRLSGGIPTPSPDELPE